MWVFNVLSGDIEFVDCNKNKINPFKPFLLTYDILNQKFKLTVNYIQEIGNA